MIREAQIEDCINLTVLSAQVWLDTYAVGGIRTEYSKYVSSTFTEQYFLKLLKAKNIHILVSENETTLQGFAIVNLTSHYRNDDNGFEIEKLYIHRLFKGQGLGRQFISQIKQKYGNQFWLYTWIENESNGFYKHLGFKHIGILKSEFYNTPIDNNVFAFNAN